LKDSVASSSALQFRRATPEDVPAIVSLVESAYRGEVSKKGWTTEAELLAGQRTDRREVSELIGGERSRIVLAERDGELVGSVMMVCADRAIVEVGMVAVRPDLQTGGVGRALLAEVERCARAEQLGTSLRMTVIGQREELIAWYERRGYRATGETKPFPYGQPRFGLPRRPDLYFRVLEKLVS
jgi:N-acetylglutamate synthase-like GNAT family acetyltransferase